MSNPDDPTDRNGKTVIRPRPGGSSPDSDRFGNEFRPSQPSGKSTVILPGIPQAFPDTGPDAGFQANKPSSPAPPKGAWRGEDGADDWMSGPVPKLSSPVTRKRIPLQLALGSTADLRMKSANPITQAATPLLILLGRLQQMIVELDAVPLMQHVATSIQQFEKTILSAGVSQDQATIAKYALCATADDIVQNLPSEEKHVWLQYSMLAQFFGVRTSGTGLFDKVRQISTNPVVYYDLLELIHACLSLGFEGQYRSAKGGDIELQRVRRDVYTTLRSVRPSADGEISPRWRGLALSVKGLADGLPLWAIGSVLLALLAGLFMFLRILLGQEADESAEMLVGLHPDGEILLSRLTFSPMAEPRPTASTLTQLQRIRGVLAPEIEQGLVAADPVGDSIVIRISNLLLFESGKAEVKSAFGSLASRIGAALDKEPGSIHVVGHTDNVKPKASSRFKSNFDLSVERAKAVANVLQAFLSDPGRLDVAGRGEDEPVMSNASEEGRAKNRRVELAIPKEIESGSSGEPKVSP